MLFIMLALDKISRLITDKDARYIFLASRHMIPFDTDEKYIKHKYQFSTGERLNLDSPVTFNEKMQWLKLHDRNPLYTSLVDKYEVKKIINGVIGEEHIIPTLGVWDRFDDINFSSLPDKYVLKTTHDSGSVVIVKDRNEFDISKARKTINRSLSRNFYFSGREWPYKNVAPRIIAEPYITDESGKELKDYKVFVFNGKPYCIQVDYDRFIEHKRNFYSLDWEYIPFTTRYPTDPNHIIEKPDCLKELIEMSARLAVFIETPPFVRTDFYINRSEIYFGEITFYHGSGYEKFIPDTYGKILGDMIVLEG